MNEFVKKIPLSWILVISFLPLTMSAVFNPGFIASDEYWTAINRYIPAESSSIGTLLKEDDVKGPLQLLPMFFVSQAVAAIGVEHPFDQYRITVALMALIGSVLLLGAGLRFSRDELQTKITLLLMGFYFASPAILTRPMFESMAAPFLAWAAVWAIRYDESKELKSLLWGALFGALAFCMRPQAGICALIFPILAIMHRNWRHLGLVAMWGVLLLVLTGLPDLWIRGSFHHSLRYLIEYNVSHGSDYGSQPAYYYLPILFVMFFGPWMFVRLQHSTQREIFLRQRALWIMLVIFVIEHTLFTHKFERFMFPLIPLVIFVLAPIWIDFVRTGRRWRARSMLAVNVILWVPATLSVPQGNIIELTRALDGRADIKELINVDRAIEWLPEAFRADRQRVRIRSVESAALTPEVLACGQWVIVHEFRSPEVSKINPSMKVFQSFRPGLIEYAAYKMNPKHNVRRGPLALMGCP